MNMITKNWLKNSTYKSVDVEEHDKDKKLVNDLLYSNSDSDESSQPRIRKKKKKLQKIKKHKVIKHYLKILPCISDEKCEFKKYNFLEHMPQDSRSKNFFVDLKGNSQIGRYGCIYEKHVSKYRLKQDNNFKKTKLSDRYFENMKAFKNDSNLGLHIGKRLCDSRCICQQPFIPVPFDIDLSLNVKNPTNNLLLEQITLLNGTVNKDPHNIDAWIKLINLQSEQNTFEYSQTSKDNIVIDRKLMILEKALSRNQSNLKLHLMRMEFGSEIWTPDKLLKEWSQLIFVHNTNIDVWRFYIAQMSRQISGFSVEKVINIYIKCFSTFFNIMSGRMKIKMIDPNMVYDLCDLFADYCEYLFHSGYTERATASWQAIIEYNFFSPSNMKPKSSGNLLDDPMLKSFQEFWQSSCPVFGNPEACGWNEYVKTRGSVNTTTNPSLQERLQQIVSNKENNLLHEFQNEEELWFELEKSRQEAWWIPHRSPNNDLEDQDRYVPFQLIQPVLITLHDLQNLSSGSLSVVTSLNAKKHLLLLFFDYLGVCYHRISMKQNLSIHRIRWQQLQQMSAIQPILSGVTNSKTLDAEFVNCCISQLKNVIDDEWEEDLSVLQLSYLFKVNSRSDSWKQTLSLIRKDAKSILTIHSNNKILWIAYTDLLVGLMDHYLFSRSDKAMSALINESSKVLQPLIQQIINGPSSPHEVLHIISLSIDLINKKHISDCNDTVREEIFQSLFIVAHYLSSFHFLSTEKLKSDLGLSLRFSEVINIISSSPDSLPTYWYQTIYFQIISQVLLLNLEKFQEWMVDDCLITISGIGSACLWSPQFLLQLSELLELTSSFISWYYRAHHRNEHAIIREILRPIIHVFEQIQQGIKRPILEIIISPKLVRNCIGNNLTCENLSQRFKLRNFLWNLVSAFETEIDAKYNHNCQASSILLLKMEIARLEKLSTENVGFNSGLSSGRADRLRSTINRLLGLHCVHWKYRLVLWHSLLKFEADQKSDKRWDSMTQGVFYRAITEMPGQKSLYCSTVSILPKMLSEITLLMKNNHVRMCAPLEEIKLLIRIRESKSTNSNV